MSRAKGRPGAPRPGNVSPPAAAAPPPPPPPRDGPVAPRDFASAALDQLLTRAHDHVQREVDAAAAAGAPPAGEMVVLVMDGTAPLAELAPPALKAAGATAFVARLLRRAALIERLERAGATTEVAALRAPLACDPRHFAFLAAVDLAGVVGCTECDLRIVPRGGAGAPRRAGGGAPS